MLMETRKKMSVFLLSSAISSLVKMREREMITPAVPGNEQERWSRWDPGVGGGKGCVCVGWGRRVWTHFLQSSPPACTSWAASPCNHRNWTAALGREEEEVC